MKPPAFPSSPLPSPALASFWTTDAQAPALADLTRIFDRAAAARALTGVPCPPLRAQGNDSPQEEGARVALLAQAKKLYTQGRGVIREQFNQTGDAIFNVQAQTFLMDGLISALFHRITTACGGEDDARPGGAVIAVGGYGRGELSPFSDIDILFLVPDSGTGRAPTVPFEQTIVPTMLYLLWDLGLKVGHATRTIADTLSAAKADMTVRTGLLEARWLAGDADLYRRLVERFRRDIVAGSQNAFMDAKLAERQTRHETTGDSRYFLEPDIKEGKGGLRDIHTLFWIADYVHGIRDAQGFVAQGILNTGEARRLVKARGFLTTLRCHLHYACGRGQERLTFDRQTTLSQLMGYRNRDAMRRVERFMKHYFLTARDVGDLSRIFLSSLRIRGRRRVLSGWRRLASVATLPPDFAIKEGWLATKTGRVFRQDPVNMLRVFACAHQLKIEIHPACLRQIARSLALIDPRLRTDRQANKQFLAMLSHAHKPEKMLTRMSEAGVLGRFVPDFGRIIGLVQHDMYHVYTVDEHTIRAIGILSGIEAGTLRDDHPLATQEMPQVQSRRALYAALFMHDLGKGRGGDHSEIGADIARTLGPRLGLDDAETETVAWLVRHHLLMSHTALRRDINDPRTVAHFAQTVQSMERLRLLLALTVADIRAVSPQAWNAWKATLLRQLYAATADHLTGESKTATTQRVQAAKARFRAALPRGVSPRLEDLGPDHYWLSQDSDAQVRQARLVDATARQDDRDGAPFHMDVHVDGERDVTEVTLCAPDRPGLFSLIAGSMVLAGGDVVDARVYTLANQSVLDVLRVQNTVQNTPLWTTPRDHQAVISPKKLSAFAAYLTKALDGTINLSAEVERRSVSLSGRTDVFSVPPQVNIDNALSNTATIIEVIGHDRPGLLFTLAHALSEAGLRMTSAKISTYGKRAVDVFYVRDIFGFKISSPSRLQALRTRLLALLGDVSAAASPPPQLASRGAAERRSLARLRRQSSRPATRAVIRPGG